MEKYIKKQYLCIILRKLKIEQDPMALFSTAHNSYEFRDFEYYYEEDNSEDGYEVNLFEESQLDKETDNHHHITKKFLSTLFIGNRSDGEIGCIIEEQTPGGSSFKCLFSKEIHDKYLPLFIGYYKNNKRITSILIENNRDKKIDEISE